MLRLLLLDQLAQLCVTLPILRLLVSQLVQPLDLVVPELRLLVLFRLQSRDLFVKIGYLILDLPNFEVSSVAHLVLDIQTLIRRED